MKEDEWSVSTLPLSANYGTRARIGILLPSGNMAAEPELAALLPGGVSFHTTRLRLTGSSREELMAMANDVEGAASLAADAGLAVLGFHCTAVSTLSEELEASILERAGKTSGVPVVATSQAIIAALRVLDARRIVLVTPYVDHINQSEVAFLGRHGVDVRASMGLGIFHAKDMFLVEPERWCELVLQHADPEADAYFISCTAIRSLCAVAELEDRLGKPVITSNHVMM